MTKQANDPNTIFSRKGNAIGFTAAGHTVCGQRRKDGSYRVWAQSADDALALTNPTLRAFATMTDARAYALSLIDAQTTACMKWWRTP